MNCNFSTTDPPQKPAPPPSYLICDKCWRPAGTCWCRALNIAAWIVLTIAMAVMLALPAFGDTPAAQRIQQSQDATITVAHTTLNLHAGLSEYPWADAVAVKQDGLVVEGGEFLGSHLAFDQIAGTALKISGRSRLDDVRISHSIFGAILSTPDAKHRCIVIDAIAKDGLTLAGSGQQVDTVHVWGADRACVITQPGEFSKFYCEAARIGTDILPGADGTRIDGLNIGPGTCWERGVRIGANGCTIVGLTGTVQGEDPAVPSHRDIAGVEILPGLVNTTVSGKLSMAGKAKGVIVNGGTTNKVEINGGWNAPCEATFVRVVGPTKNCTFVISGHGDGGIVVDKSQMIDGGGNTWDVRWDGTAKRK